MIKTTKSGSPLPTYLTQSTRQKAVTPVSKHQFQILSSGIRYAYSGSFGSGAEAAISVTLFDIGNSGNEDLKCKLTYSLDFDNMLANNYSGFSMQINGTEVMFTRGEDFYSEPQGSRTQEYDFILPKESSLKVLGITETVNVARIASIIGVPL